MAGKDTDINEHKTLSFSEYSLVMSIEIKTHNLFWDTCPMEIEASYTHKDISVLLTEAKSQKSSECPSIGE